MGNSVERSRRAAILEPLWPALQAAFKVNCAADIR
jgi:hypothetical protein